MKTKPENDTELRTKINLETARLPWSELQRHFAQGNVIYVSEELDLVDVAVRISHDDKDNIVKWMNEGRLGKATDIQAETWAASEARLWTSVVHPFILVQPEKKQLH